MKMHKQCYFISTVCTHKQNIYIISRLALEPTQSHIQWVVGVKQLGCEADHSPTYIADIKKKKKKSYTSSFYMPSWHAWGSSIFSEKKILLKCISKTQKGRVCPGFAWVRIQGPVLCAFVHMVMMACG